MSKINLLHEDGEAEDKSGRFALIIILRLPSWGFRLYAYRHFSLLQLERTSTG